MSDANPLNPFKYDGSVGTVTFFFCLFVLFDYEAIFLSSRIDNYLSSPCYYCCYCYYNFFNFFSYSSLSSCSSFCFSLRLFNWVLAGLTFSKVIIKMLIPTMIIPNKKISIFFQSLFLGFYFKIK